MAKLASHASSVSIIPPSGSDVDVEVEVEDEDEAESLADFQLLCTVNRK